MKRLTLAVISDLHIGPKACTPELQAIPNTGHHSFISQFEKLVSDEHIKPDYLLLPGDFGEISDPYELDSASLLLESIADILQLDHSKIFLCPGNHDVDWSVLKTKQSSKQPPHPVRFRQRYDPIRHVDNIFYKLCSLAKGNLFEPPHYTIWKSRQIFCTAYNSSWKDGPTGSHSGNVDLSDLTKIKEDFDASNARDFSGLKVFLLHHHVFQHAQLFWEDTSIAQNAEELIDILNEYKFDLLVHGHRHWPKFFVLKKNELHPLVILGAGTFSRTIDAEHGGLVANQFHTIEIGGKNSVQQIFGRVRSWAYIRATGWKASNQVKDPDRLNRRGQGISHIKPFGGYGSEVELTNAIRSRIISAFDGGQSIVDLNTIAAGDLQLSHTTEELLDSTLQSLGRELGFVHFNAATADNAVMLKKA